jgi:hypothetical protein
MPPKPRLALLALLCALLLTACGPRPVALVRQPIPPSLLACPQAQTPPERMSDTELAYWLLDTFSAATECRDKLIRVKELLAHE